MGLLPFMAGCGDDDVVNEEPFIPTIIGHVLQRSDSSAVAGANVMLYGANTNEPVSRAASDPTGRFAFTIAGDAYYLRVESQGYEAYPLLNGPPAPFQTSLTDTTRRTIYLRQDPDATSLGAFSGSVAISGGDGIGGVLVVASSDAATYSTTSVPGGYYVFFNAQPGTYTVTCYRSRYSPDTTAVQVPVTAGQTSSAERLTMTVGAGGEVRGHVQTVAGAPVPAEGIDITLVHPEAEVAIPGLSTLINTSSNDYVISNIPYGTYIVWASYRNDSCVTDPDGIAQQGLPIATLSSTNPDTTIGFKITGAIVLVSPTNPTSSVYPVPIYTTQPTFTWIRTSSYSSAKEYVIEVYNEQGEIIWGGFEANGTINHSPIPQADTVRIAYDFDGTAREPLRPGQTYRWKVYADDMLAAGVQTLLSSSEDLMGLFAVAVDTTAL